MGVTHATDQCNESFVVKQILDFAVSETRIDGR